MGNGSLILKKINSDSLFTLTSDFESEGYWTSKWKDFGDNVTFNSLETDVLMYGNEIDMRKGWTKFEGNPILSGSNTLLPLNEKNITDQTILLPEPPGGVPQDQAILRGKGIYKGKWVLFFNHTPDAWPNNYYWSFAVADSLSPLKHGINPFSIPNENYPTYGPINNQAPNDWLEVNGVFYAPDETYQSMSHLWMSTDMFSWTDLGIIENKVGTDPGLIHDGNRFHLFSENGNTISHCFLNIDSLKGYNNQDVLDVGDHTGDADLGFFNNRWHMFVDDGVHLHYKISYASTSPTEFPYGWELVPEIYGPHNPEQGQTWDDDNKSGNNFGTGDADIAVEWNTLYLFTERPIGVAFKELNELLVEDGQTLEIQIEIDNNGDGIADSTTEWTSIVPGKSIINFENPISGKQFRLKVRLQTVKPIISPMIKSLRLSENISISKKIEINPKHDKLFFFDNSDFYCI
jgi:hypothetical protein